MGPRSEFVDDASLESSVELPEPKRCVAFNDAANVVHEIASWHCDEETRELIWYSKDEYDFIKLRDSLLMELILTGTFRESDEHTSRGLELRLNERRALRNLNGLQVVLEAQRSQRSNNVYSPERISKMYQRISRHSRENAVLMGQLDAQAVLQCWNTESDAMLINYQVVQDQESIIVQDNEPIIVQDKESIIVQDKESIIAPMSPKSAMGFSKMGSLENLFRRRGRTENNNDLAEDSPASSPDMNKSLKKVGKSHKFGIKLRSFMKKDTRLIQSLTL